MSSETPKEEDNSSIVRVRGLPWSTTSEEISSFFSDCEMKDGSESIHLTMTREGRPSGEAYIELASEEDVEKAIKKDRQTMGKRYIEVFKAKQSEMDWVLYRSGMNSSSEQNSDNVVRLRGLPFDCTRDDIFKFFEGLDIVNDGILLTSDYQGRSSGEAFVQFSNGANVDRALKKNKQSIGHRYIEIFRSSMMEAERHQYGGYGGGSGGGNGGGNVGGGPISGRGGGMRFNPNARRGTRAGPYSRPGPPRGGSGGSNMGRGGYGMDRERMGPQQFRGGYNDEGYFGFGRGSRSGGMVDGFGGFSGGTIGGAPLPGGPPRYVVHMRGLPFRVSKSDIAEWFSPVVDPIDVYIIYNYAGKPAGEADVFFASEEDARKAMTKDRQNMQHRYVELFYDGPSGDRGGNEGGDGNMPPNMGYNSEPVLPPTGFSSSNNNNNNGYSTY